MTTFQNLLYLLQIVIIQIVNNSKTPNNVRTVDYTELFISGLVHCTK